MRNAVTRPHQAQGEWNWLDKVSGAAALLTGILLLVGMLGPLSSVLRSSGLDESGPTYPDNWLSVIFKLHAGLRGAQIGMLQGLDLPDIALLVLVAITHLGLYAALRRSSRIWSVIAAVQPFLGSLLFVATGTAGRSAVMGAGLVASFVMLRSAIFSKTTAYSGIAASGLLLIGDFSAGMPPSDMMAALFAVAYVLLIAWFFQIGRGLFEMGRVPHPGPDGEGAA